jgi:hypothetical protein
MDIEAPTSKEITFRRQPQVDQDRIRLVSSITWLGLHVPICVLDRIMEEVRETSRLAKSRTAGHEESLIVDNYDADSCEMRNSFLSDLPC